MALINLEIILSLTWFANCVISCNVATNEATTIITDIKLGITDIKLYVPFVTLSTQDNEKLLQKLKSGFKRAINWNKYK